VPGSPDDLRNRDGVNLNRAEEISVLPDGFGTHRVMTLFGEYAKISHGRAKMEESHYS
jgi:hypothetical protein